MTGKVHIRLAALAALAALVALLVPAGLAAGSHEGDPATAGDESIVYLTFDSGPNDQVTWNDKTQNITTKNNDCLAVDFDDPDGADLLNVTPIGGDLGEVKDGLGVKSANDGSGEPCGRVEAEDDEALSVTLGSDLDDYLMTAIDVDIEAKFDAIVHVEYRHEGGLVDDDMFDPSADADDGPDSKDGDNLRYFFEADGLFDEVIFTPTNGAISLEGGADGTEHDEEDDALDDTSNSSQFAIAKTFDGEITCNDPVEIGGPNDNFDVEGLVTMRSLFDGTVEQPSWDAECTKLKLYNDDVTDTSLFFEPELEDTNARYTLVFTALDQAVTTDSNGQITSLEMTYDPEAPFQPGERALQACQGQPVLDDDPNTELNEHVEFWTQDDPVRVDPNDPTTPTLLPSTPEDSDVLESACFYSATVTTTGEDTGDEVWGIYFEDDPGFFS